MKRVFFTKSFIYVFLMFLMIVYGVSSAMAEDSATPPEGYIPTNTDVEINVLASVLLIQDVAPWSSTANQTILTANGISYSIINSAAIPGTDFSVYYKIIIASDQPTSFYSAYMANKTKFDNYVFYGGMLQWHTAAWGWNGGDASGVILPGGVGIAESYPNYNYVVMPAHDLVAGVPNPFWGTAPSHSYLTNIGGATVITTTGSSPGGSPTLIEYGYGSGCVIASGQTLEYGYDHGESAGTILQNMIPYECAMPDLIVSYLSAKIQKIGSLIGRVLVQYRVKNQGNGDADSSYIAFYLSKDTVLDASDVYLGDAYIPPLSPGQEAPLPVGTQGFRLNNPVFWQVPSTWYVIAVADAWGYVNENDETNNKTVTVAVIVVK